MGVLLLHLPGLQHALLCSWRKVGESHTSGAISSIALVQQDLEVCSHLVCEKVSKPTVSNLASRMPPFRFALRHEPKEVVKFT